jgi:hypothetical protein
MIFKKTISLSFVVIFGGKIDVHKLLRCKTGMFNISGRGRLSLVGGYYRILFSFGK